jgi:carbonic anhydrase
MQFSSVNDFKYDLLAGLVVFIVAVPLCLGIAHASGAPLLSGLISGIVGGIVVGLISKSPLSVSGPAAGLTSVSIAGIHDLGSFESFALAVVLAGIFQVILGVLQTGAVSKYFPHCVISGMLAAIGLILIFKQLPHLLGYDVEVMGVEEFRLTHEDMSDSASQSGIEEKNTFLTILHSLSKIHPFISIIGISSLIFLTCWDLWIPAKFRLIPSSIFVVLLSTLAVYFYQNSGGSDLLTTEHFVNIPNINGNLSLINGLQTPDWSMITNSKVYVLAFTIAVIASIETLLCIEAIDRLDPHKRTSPTNRELFAQGIGNTVAGFLGGLPITSVIVRSSVNISVGGKTRMATMIHGSLILFGLLFLTKYLNYIPLSGLAAILVYTGYKLVSPHTLFKLYGHGMDQFIPALVTTIAILLSDLLIGIAIGLIVSMLFIVVKSYQSTSFTVYGDGLRKRMVLGESVHFLHKYKFIQFLESLPENTVLEIDASKTLFIDHDIEETLREFQERTAEKNISVTYNGFAKKA